MLIIAERLYKRGLLSKDILAEFVVEPSAHISMYIGKDDYKKITGEDWTPPAE